ncbi:hypothetical protein RhiirA1_454606 [Rhizophagus irregularis]|uniref:Uncharacterized protein n=1 Tax=Rhizophagus irregularis TaxID=588596 RepID=A0A2N0S4Q9_9GLOM|nr:hypothetical protein RhiirA1_454606 [Rhizophagus irregularis]GBC37065.2 hypothetical protein GLOIN_2v1818277 [Rhizophagus irregularis DAOM 181602=DAOM 197198]
MYFFNINSVPSDDEISLYITNDFFKNIFFTQLAIIKQEELFEILMIINPFKKKFLKEAFLLHLKYEISYSNNPNIDNYYTLQQVKELDYLINGLIIPNLTLLIKLTCQEQFESVVHIDHVDKKIISFFFNINSTKKGIVLC